MERGYQYHANFIYNQPKIKTKKHTNEDQKLSLDIVKHAVNRMREWGLQDTYYDDRDAMPGSNVFTEFFNSVKQSRYTIVVVTKGFINDLWTRYKSQSAFLKLLDTHKSSRFIAFYVDIDPHHIPEEMSVMEALHFDDNWKTNEESWRKLESKLRSCGSVPVQDTGPDPFPPVQDTGRDPRPSVQDTGRDPRPSSSSGQNVLYQRTSNNNPLRGVQDTNPPRLPAARGNSLEIDGLNSPEDHNTNSLQGQLNSANQSSGTNQHNSPGCGQDRTNQLNSHGCGQDSHRSADNTRNDQAPPSDTPLASNRQPPDGAAVDSDAASGFSSTSSRLQSFDSITELKGVVGNGNNDSGDIPYSSLNNQDVEEDTNLNNRGGDIDSMTQRIRPGNTTPLKSPECEDLPPVACYRPSEGDTTFHNHSESPSLLERGLRSTRQLAVNSLISLLYKSDLSFI